MEVLTWFVGLKSNMFYNSIYITNVVDEQKYWTDIIYDMRTKAIKLARNKFGEKTRFVGEIVGKNFSTELEIGIYQIPCSGPCYFSYYDGLSWNDINGT
jgi:hypothetical protein